MSKTEYFYLSGKAKWAKLKTPDPEYQNYTIDLYMEPEVVEQFKAMKTALSLRVDEEGTYVRFRRSEGEVPWTVKEGESNMFGPPKLLLTTGVDDRGVPSVEPFEGSIGNGSDVTLKVQVRELKNKRKATRLEAVRIDKLVEYTGGGERVATPEMPF